MRSKFFSFKNVLKARHSFLFIIILLSNYLSLTAKANSSRLNYINETQNPHLSSHLLYPNIKLPPPNENRTLKYSAPHFAEYEAHLTSKLPSKSLHTKKIENINLNSTHQIHYYLSDLVENNRRVFYLFRAQDKNLQDLVERKSFSLESNDAQIAAQNWLNKTIQKYQLEKSSTAPTNFINTDLVSFSMKDIPELKTLNEEKLWTATQEWSSSWESEYGRWVKETLTPSFMLEHNLESDCADLAYTLRWVFAYIHKLPMASHLGGSKQLFTNESVKTEWLSLPTDPLWNKNRRFLAALKYILRNTYTHTLMKDSYPVPISVEKLTPGTHHLSLHSNSGHTMIVHNVNEPYNLPITLLYSTMPIQVRKLISTFYQDPMAPELFNSGFYKIRWTKKSNDKWTIIPAKSIPDYSEEQFNLIPEGDQEKLPYFIYVFKKLNPDFSLETMLSRSFEELQDRIQDRIQIVIDGYNFCQKNDCSPGTTGDEDWSTPSRDKRLLQIHNTINTASDILIRVDNNILQKWKKIVSEKASEKKLAIHNQFFSLNEILLALNYQLTQSDPRLSIERRWGVNPAKGYGLTLIAAAERLLPLRESMIQQAESCRKQKCDFYSNSYKKLNTFYIDQELLNMWTGARVLCEYSQSTSSYNSTENSECGKLDTILSSKKFGNQTLLEVFAHAQSWMSNPNSKIEERWGLHGTLLELNSHSREKATAFFTKDKKWFILNKQLFNSNSMTTLSFSSTETLGQIHLNSEHYFTYEINDDHLILRFYTLPQNMYSEMSLNIEKNSLRRIWWSSPSKKTLSIFTNTHFFEVDPINKAIINQMDILNFSELQIDPRISVIETSSGFFMSDTQVDASLFTPFPLTINKLNSVFHFQRTEKGWLFRTFKNAFYLEQNIGSVFQEDGSLNNSYFITTNSQIIFKSNFDNITTEVYPRIEDNTSQKPTYKLSKTLDATVQSMTTNLINLLDKKKLVSTYLLPNMEPISLQCKNLKAQLVLVSDDYYSCFSESKIEFLYKDGSLLLEGRHLGFEFKKSHRLINDDSDWLITRRYNGTLSNDSNSIDLFPLSEYYKISNGEIEGPYFQETKSYQDYITYVVIEENLESVHKTEFGIAPAPLFGSENTNFGLTKKLPRFNSFVLDSSLNFNKTKQLLFIPHIHY